MGDPINYYQFMALPVSSVEFETLGNCRLKYLLCIRFPMNYFNLMWPFPPTFPVHYIYKK